jgi:signal transduction histidine kinase
MKRRIPLAAKLGVTFIVVILLAVGLVYGLILWSIPTQFDEYRRTSREKFATEVAALLANYREETGGWVGVGEMVLTRPYVVTLGEQSLEGKVSIFDVPFGLFERDGSFIATNSWEWLNTFVRLDSRGAVLPLDDEQLSRGIPIHVGGRREGTLVVGDIGNPGAAEAVFLSTVAESALIGGGIAIGLSLLLSTLLMVQILRPLHALSRATERVTEGTLPDKVKLRTHDEIGRLGESFNQMLESLKRSETVRQTMTADIAHEIRTPVTIIQGTLEAILDGIYEASEESIAPIYEETLHLGRLIDDLRDLALAEAGELRLEKEPVDLVDLVQQVAEMAFLPREEAPKLHFNASEGLPKVLLDRKRFRQVIANLLSNALRHTPKNGDVSIRIHQVGDQIEMIVADSGSGIRPIDLPHLFERFYRADPARGRSGGSGLGLAIVKQWVEAHGGSIRAENRSGGGAQFTVRLPVS